MKEYRTYVKTIASAYLIWDMANAKHNCYDVVIRTVKNGYKVEWRTYG
jgi:hypothetical protein